jgi:hypothetical protein
MGNIFWGLAIAAALAATVIVPKLGNVSTWKIVLAVVGVLLFVAAGSKPSKTKDAGDQ